MQGFGSAFFRVEMGPPTGRGLCRAVEYPLAETGHAVYSEQAGRGNMGTFQLYFELIGAVAFAISGAALGIRKGMDLFGVAMVGMTTAVGGGILRDVMLGQTPPAALQDPTQALVAIAVSMLCFYIWRWRKTEMHNRYADAVLLVADSIGLGIFSAHGAAIAIQAGHGANWFLVLFLGTVTGVGGGVVYFRNYAWYDGKTYDTGNDASTNPAVPAMREQVHEQIDISQDTFLRS